MSVHWGGKGPGHVSRWPRGVGAMSPYSGATMLLDFLNPVLDPRITFSRGTGATRVNASGFIELVGNTTPRFDYDPVTLAPRGLLIEEARTNLLTYSDQFNNAAWSTSGATITANATASPDGTANADALVEDASTGLHITQQFFTFLNATAYTVSVYIKASTRTWVQVALPAAAFTASQGGFFNLTGAGSLGTVTGTPTSRSITAVGNGWYRITITATSTAAAGGNIAIVAASADGTTSYTGTNGAIALFAYGAQLEAGSFATSYIPTVASTVTRNADVATMTGTNFSSWYNQSEGTFVVDYDQIAATASQIKALFIASDGTSNNRVYGYIGNTGQPTLLVTNGGVTQANPNNAIIASGPATKTAFGYKLDDFAIVTAGAAAATDVSGTVPLTTNRLDIGCFGTGTQTNGHIRTIAYYNTRLPNAQLQTLTAPSLATTLSLDFTSGSYNVGF